MPPDPVDLLPQGVKTLNLYISQSRQQPPCPLADLRLIVSSSPLQLNLFSTRSVDPQGDTLAEKCA